VPNFLDEPEFWVWIHGIATAGWFFQFPLVYAWKQNLQDSVKYLIFISIASAALGQLSSWQAARVELKLKRIQERRDTD
jgi:hypothetical protein